MNIQRINLHNFDSSTISRKAVTPPHFRYDIEGLRAIAIILVVGYHFAFPGFTGGYVGVDIFFVVSGYLITWLLVHEAEETGAINLINFYSRRARRLLPAVVVMLTVSVIVSAVLFAPFEQIGLATASGAASVYTSNFYFAWKSVDYLGARITTNPFLHTWSLGVEEQFYLIWPLLVMFAFGVFRWQKRKYTLMSLLVWLGVVVFISLSSSIYLTNEHQPWAFFLLPTRAWEFASGALGLLVPTNRWINQKGGYLKRVYYELLGFIGICGILFSTFMFNDGTIFPGITVLIPVVSTVLMLRVGSVKMDTAAEKLLYLPVMQTLGQLSYSWYLWHWPVLIFASMIIDLISMPFRLILLALSLIFAKISYHLIENPIHHNRWLMGRSILTLGLAVLITIFGVGFSITWRKLSVQWSNSPGQIIYTNAIEPPDIYSSGCHLDYNTVEINIDKCTTGIKDSSHTAVLFGDSHAAQWFPALEQLAFKEGWRLVTLTKSSCSFVDSPILNNSLGREYRECDEWRQLVFQFIREEHPYLVIMASSSNYSFSNGDLFDGVDKTLKQVSPVSQHVVLLRDPPRIGFDVSAYLARRNWSRLSKPSNDNSKKESYLSVGNYNLLKQSVRNYENVLVIDMDPFICPSTPCPLIKDKIPVYRDSNHLSKEYILSLTPVLTKQILVLIQQ